MSLFTIGHSNSKAPEVAEFLRVRGINKLIDVRSVPYSRFNFGFNKDKFDRTLANVGIEYYWRGETLGGKSVPGVKTQALLDQIAKSAKERPTVHGAFMCSEGNPCDCHRHHWLSQYLYTKHGIDTTNLFLNKEDKLSSEIGFSKPMPTSLGYTP